jgi:hypothetical protein
LFFVLNPIHSGTASNVKSNHEQSTNFRAKAEVSGVFRRKDQALMNSQTTYTLLVRSEEKNRDLLETAVYAMCVLSAVVAIWQFVEQSSGLSVDGLVLQTQPAPVFSHHAAERHLNGKS